MSARRDAVDFAVDGVCNVFDRSETCACMAVVVVVLSRAARGSGLTNSGDHSALSGQLTLCAVIGFGVVCSYC